MQTNTKKQPPDAATLKLRPAGPQAALLAFHIHTTRVLIARALPAGLGGLQQNVNLSQREPLFLRCLGRRPRSLGSLLCRPSP